MSQKSDIIIMEAKYALYFVIPEFILVVAFIAFISVTLMLFLDLMPALTASFWRQVLEKFYTAL